MMNRNAPALFTAIAVVVAAAAFWFGILAPKRAQASDLEAQVLSAQTSLDQIRQQAVTLRAAKQSFATDYSKVVRLGKAVPTDDDVRSLMVQLDAAAKRSGVDFRTIQLGGGSGTTTPTPATVGAAPAQSTTATLPPGASVGTAGFPTMPFSFEFRGRFFTLSDFFARLERLVKVRERGVDVSGRLLTIDAFTLKPGADGFPSVTASIGATAYLLPGSNGAVVGAPVAQPVSAGTTAPGAAPTTPATASAIGGIR